MPQKTARPKIYDNYARLLGRDDPVEVMASTPDLLRGLTGGLTERQLATRPASGKWAMKEIVAHLLDGEVILGARYRLIAAHDRPALAGYDQDAFVEKLGPLRAKTADLVDDFAMARAVNLGLLTRLPEDSWDRVGIHAERGEESIRSLVFMYAGHDRHHLSQIETIRVGLFPSRKRRAAERKTSAPRGQGRAKTKAKTRAKTR